MKAHFRAAVLAKFRWLLRTILQPTPIKARKSASPRQLAATKPLRSGQPCPETHALPVKTLARLPNKTPLQLHALAAKDNGNLYDPAEFMCTRRMACMGRVGGIDGARFDEFVRVVESYSLM
ncbi:hypothetical protein BC938DRAFT_480602 [Jimgerdemannia flammicorona]|uniref:Uncharacterized protein n=1 Tax=Jimgerdemannia flammicorona TaxID=994334 RepID=A0A433QX78_9FUNG|nr:hypothetical protein BC938DRAFT_480602 [Jimgerdemannia flammicorona]